ncbi:MAG TPA: IPTL-CTERM sorting domain-containing protein [Thermoanaerobaculia bacterium]|nr:IPTL-CTERM sorting domain-containing protein [Thermoanaerobaculia bacterium]
MEQPVSELTRQRRRARQRRQRKAAASGAALTLGVALAASPAAQAATFTVTNLDDAGAGSLRQAIEDANGAAGADTITFDPGLNGAITLTSGQLSITDSVDIQGPGAATLAVTANDASRVFYLYNNASILDVTISGLTIAGGNASIGGGIVDFDENLTLDAVTLTGNSATSDGGALWADGFNMTLTIRDSVITGNAAGDDGGGIYVEDTGGPLLIQNTVISGNQANDKGGGIYFYDPDDDVTIDNSTISGNTAGSLGGGIYLYSPDGGNWLITNTTISGNDAAAGGGLFFYSADHPLLIQNSTISGNQATVGNGGGIYFYNLYAGTVLDHTTVANNTAAGSGGGIFLNSSALTLTNSIVADNTAATDNDVSNGVEASFEVSFSLIESPGAATITDNGGTILNQDPQLGPLQNNGGTTLTQRPAPTSPAVNTGDPAFTPPPATDQRGANRIQNGRTDMGAVEVGASGTIQLTVTTTSVNESAGTVTITATRTGGSDGAVSVTFSTSNGTAQSPADYNGTVGTLSWADGDTAPKSFTVAILDDAVVEPSETFNVTLSNPQGGATLGSNVTEVVTIVDDDAAIAVPVPTLGEYGMMLLTALFGLGGVLMIRRKKGLAAPMLVVSMALGAAGAPAEAADHPSSRAESRVTTLARIQAVGEEVVIRLSDGTTYRIGEKSFQLVDGRKGKGHHGTTPELRSIPADQPVFLKVRHDRTGKVKRIRLELADSAAAAQARLQAQRD